MRIYAAADIHGKENHIRKIYSVIQEKKPDVLILPGDITAYFNSHKAIKALEKIPIPVFAIRGNWDFPIVDRLIRKESNMHLITPAPINYNGVELIGTGGTISFPFLSKIKLSEKKILDLLAANINPNSILIVHPPPRGVLDRVGTKFSAGSFGLAQLIKKHPPRMLLCGHIHEQSGYDYIDNTLVVNCAMNKICGGAIIDYDKKNQLKVEMIMN